MKGKLLKLIVRVFSIAIWVKKQFEMFLFIFLRWSRTICLTFWIKLNKMMKGESLFCRFVITYSPTWFSNQARLTFSKTHRNISKCPFAQLCVYYQVTGFLCFEKCSWSVFFVGFCVSMLLDRVRLFCLNKTSAPYVAVFLDSGKECVYKQTFYI